jgi:glycosyltransferase involved in cell wall biosynthesis
MPTSMSVVIPTYNRSADLERALASIAAQTRPPYEVIVCDDGSEEDIRAVVDRFASRVNTKYIRISKSGGPGRPRNIAVAEATGTWISFLDSDDWWDPDRIEALQPFLREPVDVVYHRLRMVYTAGVPSFRRRLRHVGFDCGADPLRLMITRANPIPNSAAVVRRASLTALGGITEDFTSVEDFDTWLRLAEAGGVFRYLDWSLGGYTSSTSNISAFSKKQLLRMRALFERHLPLIPDALKGRAESHFSYVIGTYAIRLELFPMAERYLSRVRAGESASEWARATVKRLAIRAGLARLLPE